MTTPEARARQAASGPARRRFGDQYVITADRVFDGTRVLEGHAVAISEDKITAVAPAGRLSGPGERIRFAGTLLPGFIELHAHLRLGQVPPDVVLRHGLTTVRETGGPLAPPSGGDGRLRLLAAGPILTAPRGYPVPVFGPAPALEVADIPAAREAVGRLLPAAPRSSRSPWSRADRRGRRGPAGISPHTRRRGRSCRLRWPGRSSARPTRTA